MNKNIMYYMGDMKKSGITNYQEFRNYIVSSATADKIVDELYCQLICQLTDNPSTDSINRGWELFVALAAKVPPSDFLFNYVLYFLIRLYKVVGNIGAYAMYSIKLLLNVEKCKNVTVEKLEELSNINSSSNGTFKCSIDEVLLLEANTQLLYQYNILPKSMGKYGSISLIGAGYKYLTPYLSPNTLYNILVYGGYVGVILKPKSKEKEKRIYVSPQLDSITIYNPLKTSNNTQSIPLTNFIGVSYSSEDFVSYSEDYNDKTFVLVSHEKGQNVQIVMKSLQERNHSILAYRCYFEWYNAVGKDVSYTYTVDDLRTSFINYTTKILKNPHDFYRVLTSGVPCYVSKFNDDNIQHRGILKLSQDLLTINLYSPQQTIDLSLKYNDIDDVVLYPPKNSKINKRRAQAFYLTAKDPDKSWCISFADQFNYIHYSYMFYCYTKWIIYRNNDILDRESNPQNFSEYCSTVKPPPIISSVPRIVYCLINRLKELNAWSYQGIFRQSANSKKVDEMCTILNQGYYEQIEICDNAYVVSVCLKKWLRDMNKPLVYNYNINRYLMDIMIK